MNAEIASLRAEEATMQRNSEVVDRWCRDLMGKYACTFVTSDDVPYQCYARLPWDWARGVKVPVTAQRGMPPRDMRGPVAVSTATLKWIADNAP
jgi:hypothetical protein